MRTLSRRDLSMAKFIGSDLQSDNWGEDYLIKKMMEYFDDSFVIYRNCNLTEYLTKRTF